MLKLLSKSTVTNSLQKCDHCTQICHFSEDLHIAYSIDYSNPFLTHNSNRSHTHNSNHLEPLEKIESPQLASLALGANKPQIFAERKKNHKTKRYFLR